MTLTTAERNQIFVRIKKHKKNMENYNAASDSEFSSQEEIEEVNLAINVMETEATDEEFQRLVAEVIGRWERWERCFVKVFLKTNLCKSIFKHN